MRTPADTIRFDAGMSMTPVKIDGEWYMVPSDCVQYPPKRNAGTVTIASVDYNTGTLVCKMKGRWQ